MAAVRAVALKKCVGARRTVPSRMVSSTDNVCLCVGVLGVVNISEGNVFFKAGDYPKAIEKYSAVRFVACTGVCNLLQAEMHVVTLGGLR